MMHLPRRSFIALLLAVVGCAQVGCAQVGRAQLPTGAEAQPPIVFVHGNGDTAALWNTTIWRFESNGYDRNRLHAIDLRYPLARSDDSKPQPLRSSSDDARRELAARVDEVRKLTGGGKVVLIGQSRGGNAIRNYVKNGGGATAVSHAILSVQPEIGGFLGLLRLDAAESGAHKMHLYLPANHPKLPWLGIFTGLTILNFFLLDNQSIPSAKGIGCRY